VHLYSGNVSYNLEYEAAESPYQKTPSVIVNTESELEEQRETKNCCEEGISPETWHVQYFSVLYWTCCKSTIVQRVPCRTVGQNGHAEDEDGENMSVINALVGQSPTDLLIFKVLRIISKVIN